MCLLFSNCIGNGLYIIINKYNIYEQFKHYQEERVAWKYFPFQVQPRNMDCSSTS